MYWYRQSCSKHGLRRAPKRDRYHRCLLLLYPPLPKNCSRTSAAVRWAGDSCGWLGSTWDTLIQAWLPRLPRFSHSKLSYCLLCCETTILFHRNGFSETKTNKKEHGIQTPWTWRRMKRSSTAQPCDHLHFTWGNTAEGNANGQGRNLSVSSLIPM